MFLKHQEENIFRRLVTLSGLKLVTVYYLTKNQYLMIQLKFTFQFQNLF